MPVYQARTCKKSAMSCAFYRTDRRCRFEISNPIKQSVSMRTCSFSMALARKTTICDVISNYGLHLFICKPSEDIEPSTRSHNSLSYWVDRISTINSPARSGRGCPWRIGPPRKVWRMRTWQGNLYRTR